MKSAYFLFVFLIVADTLWLSTPYSQDWQQLLGERYEIIEQKGNLATIQDKYTGREVVRLLDESVTPSHGLALDTLYADTTVVIKLWEIDTTQFANRFQLMGTIPLAGYSQPLLIFDSNQNGFNEIIGIHKKDYWPIYDIENRFYEYNASGFDSVVMFPAENGGRAKLGCDIDGDNNWDILFKYGDSIRIYEAPASNQYATEFRFSYDINNAIVSSGISVDDFDGDGHQEVLYIGSVFDSSGVELGEGSSLLEHVSGDTGYIKTFSIAYPSVANPLGNYAIGDFDLDGKKEFFTADVYGVVYGVENVANDSFRIHWQGQLPTKHAFYHFSVGDLDGDGLPEFFMGGFHSTGYQNHLITAFETTGDNQYHPYWAVNIQGGGSFYTPQIVHGDVDGDGVDEFTVDVGGMVLTFKAAGNDNYELFWAKSVSWADGVAMGDVDGDGKAEIIISTRPINNQGIYTRSYIYKFDSTAMGIPSLEPPLANTITLYPNYPNPFNASTTFRYRLPKTQHVTLTIYNILGKEVITLIDKRQSAGSHSIKWDGKNKHAKEVSSGIYFMQLRAGEQRRGQKIALIR